MTHVCSKQCMQAIQILISKYDTWYSAIQKYLGLNLKNSGVFSYGAKIPWLGIAVTSELRLFSCSFGLENDVCSLVAMAAAVLLLRSVPWRQ